MKHIKSERLKRLEGELNDLQQWLKLGLVPKKDIEKHKEEIQTLQLKIDEEKERIQLLRESGEVEEFTAPKRQQGQRSAYTEMPSAPHIDVPEGSGLLGDSHFELDADLAEGESDDDEEKEEGSSNEEGSEISEDESYFSDRNRWRRGGIIDPDVDDW